MIPTEPGWWSVRWKAETGLDGVSMWRAGEVWGPGESTWVSMGEHDEPVSSDKIEFGCQLFPGPADTGCGTCRHWHHGEETCCREPQGQMVDGSCPVWEAETT